MGCICSCCDMIDDGAGIFKPLSKRCCTDVLCLLIFVVYFVAMIGIGIFSLGNGNINYILYPTDYLDQFCGHSSLVSNRTKAFYPKLSEDLTRQKLLIASGLGIVHFTPYTLCVNECPSAFSLSDPIPYGGASYPGAKPNASNPTIYTSFSTKEIFSRCLPVIDNQPELDRQLCAKPKCNDPSVVRLETDGIQQINCTVGADRIDSTPEVTEAWVIASPQATALCEFEVKEVNTQRFLPPGATAESIGLERQFAEFITTSFTVLMSVLDSWLQVVVMGIGAPFAFAGVWFILLFVFAGLIVLLSFLLLGAILVALCIYLYVKAGWADGGATLPRTSNAHFGT